MSELFSRDMLAVGISDSDINTLLTLSDTAVLSVTAQSSEGFVKFTLSSANEDSLDSAYRELSALLGRSSFGADISEFGGKVSTLLKARGLRLAATDTSSTRSAIEPTELAASVSYASDKTAAPQPMDSLSTAKAAIFALRSGNADIGLAISRLSETVYIGMCDAYGLWVFKFTSTGGANTKTSLYLLLLLQRYLELPDLGATLYRGDESYCADADRLLKCVINEDRLHDFVAKHRAAPTETEREPADESEHELISRIFPTAAASVLPAEEIAEKIFSESEETENIAVTAEEALPDKDGQPAESGESLTAELLREAELTHEYRETPSGDSDTLSSDKQPTLEPDTDTVPEAIDDISNGTVSRKRAAWPVRLLSSVLPWVGNSAAVMIGKLLLLAVCIASVALCVCLVSDFSGLEAQRALSSELNAMLASGEALDNANEPSENGVLNKFTSLYSASFDLEGWISCRSGELSAPIMSGKNDYFYSSHDFYGSPSKFGSLFTDVDSPLSDEPCYNTVIYGKGDRDGSPFASLSSYESADFLSKNPILELSSLYSTERFIIFAVIKTNADSYLEFADTSPSQKSEYLTNAANASIFKTSVSVTATDRLLTLVSRTDNDQRLIILARLYKDGESETVNVNVRRN